MVTENQAATRADFSLPCLGAASTCMLLMCEVQAFPTFLSVPVILQPVKEGLSPRYKIPGLGHPVRGFHCSLPMVILFPWILPFPGTKSPPKGTGPHPIILISFLPNYMWIILIVLFVQQSFSNFQLVFSENCSTSKCIFDVFMGEGELHILLLCHLNLWSTINLMQCKRLLKFLYPQLFQMPPVTLYSSSLLSLTLPGILSSILYIPYTSFPLSPFFSSHYSLP